MEAEPHTHEPRLKRFYRDSGRWQIIYGDTLTHVCLQWRKPTKRLVEKATKRAIRRHDKGSIKAGEAVERKQKLQEVANQVRFGWK